MNPTLYKKLMDYRTYAIRLSRSLKVPVATRVDRDGLYISPRDRTIEGKHHQYVKVQLRRRGEVLLSEVVPFDANFPSDEIVAKLMLLA